MAIKAKPLVGIAQAHRFRRAGKLNAEVIALTFPVLFDWVLED
jgi:hypothetical protein